MCVVRLGFVACGVFAEEKWGVLSERSVLNEWGVLGRGKSGLE